jgi:hypothetical protein
VATLYVLFALFFTENDVITCLIYTSLPANMRASFIRSLQGNKFTGPIPSVIGLMQALAVL